MTTKAFPYVSPSAITLREETEYQVSDGWPTARAVTKQWEAEYIGPTFNHDGTFVTSNGPSLVMRRTGATADEAYKNLTQAIIEQGYEFRR